MSQSAPDVILLEAEPQPIEIQPLKTAVILVDMQNAFVHRGGYLDLVGIDLSSVQGIVDPCRRILAAARSGGMRVLYLQMAYSERPADRDPKATPAFRKSPSLTLIQQHPEWADRLCYAGTWGAEIIEELKPAPEDIVVRKEKYDGFIGTDLEAILKEYGIRFLIFAGTATNICVESTLRHAFFLDYFPILVSDAVSQKGIALLQEATLANVQSNFGWVTTTEHLVRAVGHGRGDD